MTEQTGDGRFGLAGKRVLLTGGTAGIGRAVAERFVDVAASVVISGRRSDGAAVAAGVGAEFIAADVSVERDIAPHHFLRGCTWLSPAPGPRSL